MTTDVKMTVNAAGIFDLTVDSTTADFTTEDSFDSAILYSFFGERRASDSEVLISQYRRGWIGNLTEDYENGSKTWLLYQARLTRDTLNRFNTEALNGWIWLVNDNLLKDITVETDFVNGAAGLVADFVRFDSLVDRKFFPLWDNTGS